MAAEKRPSASFPSSFFACALKCFAAQASFNVQKTFGPSRIRFLMNHMGDKNLPAGRAFGLFSGALHLGFFINLTELLFQQAFSGNS
jgi:hypothetical protein